MDRAPTEVVLARLRGVLDAAQESLVLVDPDGRISEINQAALRLGRRERHEAVGHSIEAIAVAAGGDAAEIEAIRTVLAGEPVQYVAVRGDRRTEVTATPLEGGGAAFVSQGVEAYREEDARALRARLLSEAAQGAQRPCSAGPDARGAGGHPGARLVGQLPVRARRARRHRATGRGPQRQRGHPCRGAATPAHPCRPDRPPEDCWTARSPRAGRWWSRTLRTAGLSQTTSTTTEQLDVRSIAVAPLIDHDELVGLIVLATTVHSGRILRADELEVLGTLADRTAAAVRAARLHDAARAAEARFRAAFEHAPIGIALSQPNAARPPRLRRGQRGVLRDRRPRARRGARAPAVGDRTPRLLR